MAKTKPKTIPTQKDIGSFWQLANVAEKYGVPPTNIVRASRRLSSNSVWNLAFVIGGKSWAEMTAAGEERMLSLADSLPDGRRCAGFSETLAAYFACFRL